jgi:FixJ family two-component response regulator
MTNSKNPLIYVVDDDASFRKMICAFLHQNRLSYIKQFSSGEEMLEQFATTTPSIVVQDFDLGPGKLTGLEILKKAREMKQNIDFIFLSGQSNINVAVDIIKNGAFDYVIKDDSAQDNLLNRIKRLIFQVRLIRSQKVLKRALLLFFAVVIVTVVICYLIGMRVHMLNPKMPAGFN